MIGLRWFARTAMALLLCCPLANAGEVRAVGTHFARVFELSETGEFIGLAADLLREYGRRSGDTVRFAIYPWARAQALVERGEADILIGPYKTPERELRFAFSDRAFYQDRMLFYVRTGVRSAWNGNYATLRGKRVAIVHGWAYGIAFEEARPMMQIERAQTLENGLLMLVHDRVELLATNFRNTDALLPRMELIGKVVPIAPHIDVQNGYFGFPKGPQHEAMRQRFNEVFNAMVASGELARIAKRHYVDIP